MDARTTSEKSWILQTCVSHLFGKEITSHHNLVFNSDTGVSWYHWIQPGEHTTQQTMRSHWKGHRWEAFLNSWFTNIGDGKLCCWEKSDREKCQSKLASTARPSSSASFIIHHHFTVYSACWGNHLKSAIVRLTLFTVTGCSTDSSMSLLHPVELNIWKVW